MKRNNQRRQICKNNILNLIHAWKNIQGESSRCYENKKRSMPNIILGNWRPEKTWPNVFRMTQIWLFTKSAALVCKMAICIFSRMLWRVIRWIAINCKVPLCHANELNPPKTFPLHFSPATKGPADIMSVILSLTQVWVLKRTRLEITLSCWLSSNNRLEASKGGWCLESNQNQIKFYLSHTHG